MPAYSATGNRVALYQPGDAFAVWNADTQAAVTASPASQQVALGQTNAEDSQSASVEIKFSGAPGAFSSPSRQLILTWMRPIPISHLPQLSRQSTPETTPVTN